MTASAHRFSPRRALRRTGFIATALSAERMEEIRSRA